MDFWRVTQQILYDFRNRFLISSPRNSILVCFDTRKSLHMQLWCNIYSSALEPHHKCSRMCLWRDVDMQRIIDEPEIVVTDYWQKSSSFTNVIPFAIYDLVWTNHSAIAVLLLSLLWLTHFIPLWTPVVNFLPVIMCYTVFERAWWNFKIYNRNVWVKKNLRHFNVNQMFYGFATL